jgi:hypothetical protein
MPTPIIAGYNKDGSPYYVDTSPAGGYIGLENDPNAYQGMGPGPTAVNLAGAGVPGYTNSSTPPTLGKWQIPSLSQALNAALDGLLHPIDSLTGNTNNMDSAIVAGKGPLSTATSAIGSLESGAAAFLNILTDVPRVATIAIGLILLIIGGFALTGRNVTEVITSAAKAGAE